MSQDPRQDNMHDELLADLASAAPEVPEMRAVQREQIWAAVLAEVQGAAGAAATAQDETTSHEPRARRLFPSGVLGRSVLALAACSAAIAVGVAAWPQHTRPAVTASGDIAAQVVPQSELGPVQQPAPVPARSALAAPDSTVAETDTQPQAQKMSRPCMPYPDFLSACGVPALAFGASLPLAALAAPADDSETDLSGPDGPQEVLLTVDTPTVSVDAVGNQLWSVELQVSNTTSVAHSIAALQVHVYPADATSKAEQCTVRSQQWRSAGVDVDDVRSLAPRSSAALVVTAACAATPDNRPPWVRTQWETDGGISDALFADRL